MQSVCVFCGSSAGRSPVYAERAAQLGRELVERQLRLVFGGGCIGLMGVLADVVMAAGGEAIGVIPEFLLQKELGHAGVTKLHVVDSMHERKAMMADLSDAFIALPGGIGTLEELCETMTWSQLGLHAKPIGLLNVDGYFDGLLQMLTHGVTEGFMRDEHLRLFVTAEQPTDLLEKLITFQPLDLPKWIDRDET